MRTTSAAQRNQPETRERILEAALASFSRKGFDGATTREIARSARVPLGLLRYYFGGKLKLWQAAVDSAFAELTSGLDVPLDVAEGEDDEVAGIRSAIRNHVHYVARNPEFVRLMHDEGKRPGPRMRWLVDRHVKPIFARLIPMTEHLQKIGRIPNDIDSIHLVYCLIGSIDVIFHQAEECRRVTGVDPAEPAAIEAHARAVEYMLLGPPPTSPSLRPIQRS